MPPAAYLRASTGQAGHPPVVVSTAACGRRLGGGLALDGLFTGLDRAPERTGDSPPRHIPSPTSLRAHHCVPSNVYVRPCSKGPHSPTSSGSAFPIKNGSEFSIGPTKPLKRSKSWWIGGEKHSHEAPVQGLDTPTAKARGILSSTDGFCRRDRPVWCHTKERPIIAIGLRWLFPNSGVGIRQ